MYPTDSFGNICGRGEFSAKPLLMFFDLTKCASLTALAGCPTPQVCVAECPQHSYSPWLEAQVAAQAGQCGYSWCSPNSLV